MKKALYLIMGIMLLMTQNLMAQNRIIRGVVTDHEDLAVIGANVIVKGTPRGVITDFNGHFTIKAPDKGVLLISYIGYITAEVKILPGKEHYEVKLKEDTETLDEVVVVGYGTQKKSELTSSVEVIKADDILKMPTPRLDKALAGQVAGMTVMQTGDPTGSKESQIRIRANGNVNTAPLLVIDGVPRYSTTSNSGEMRLSDLNPDDIESISVLKDAAAAAVYGLRAANGVILVKTKRGSQEKTRVSYHGTFNLTKATKLPDFLDSYEFAGMFNQAVENSPGTSYKKFTPEQMEMIKNHTNPNVYADENLLDYMKDYGYNTSHSVSLSGGAKKMRYYLSLGYTNTVGMYSGVGNDSYNYSSKIDIDLLEGLVLSVDLSGNRSNNKQTSFTAYSDVFNYSPLQPLEYTDGTLASIGDWSAKNPLINVRGIGDKITNRAAINSTRVNLNYNAPWLKGLSMYVRATFDNSTTERTTFKRPVDLYLYNEETKETTLDPRSTYPRAKISIAEEKGNIDNKLFEAGINFTRTFAEKHSTHGMVVVNYQTQEARGLNARNSNLPSLWPEILAGGQNWAAGNKSKAQRASMVGRLKYGYDRRYFIETNFRVDGSVKLHPDNRWAFFPTASASWAVHNEPFFKNWKQNTLSSLKFRLSTGLLGMEPGQPYGYLNKYNMQENMGYMIGNTYRYGLNRRGSYPNPNLKWGEVKDYNGAVDLGLWGGKLGFTFEYYTRYRTNMVQSLPNYLFPLTTGRVELGTPEENYGKIKAYGWDMSISHNNRVGKFNYYANLNFGWSRDKIVDNGDESNLPEYQRRKGHSSGDQRMLESLGFFTSQEEIDNWAKQGYNNNIDLAPGDIKYKDQNGDGRIDNKDQIWYKNAAFPDLTGSLSLGGSYKNFHFSMMFNGIFGYNKTINEKNSLYGNKLPRFQKYHQEECWTKDNQNDAKLPRVKFSSWDDPNQETSSFWVRKCDFVRLSSINVGYSLPKKITEKMHIARMSISLTAGNVFTWTDLKGMDPEVDRGYPIQRSFGASLSMGF